MRTGDIIMLLDLRDIIDVPGSSVSFDFEPDLSRVPFGSIVRMDQNRPPKAVGSLFNRAGVLTFVADLDALCTCVCARCLKEFEYPVNKQISAYLTEEGEGSENTDAYLFQGDKADINEIIVSELVLGLDERVLCRDDCAGLCEKCGSDLNHGSCNCKKSIDPRLAVLAEFSVD